jgi:hypothetical protein
VPAPQPGAARGCRTCGRAAVSPLADFGHHPVSSRLLPSADALDETFHLVMARCPACGVVQLVEPPPVERLMAAPEWVVYNEPDRHLDPLADALAGLPMLTGRVAAGLGAHAQPLLARLAARGFSTWSVDTRAELGVDRPVAGPAALQDRLTVEGAARIAAGHGAADLVVSRYTYEHAYDPIRHLEALSALARPGGLVAIEVPDCTTAFATRDYTTLWEEHVLYLTAASLARAVTASGWEIVYTHAYPNALHDALVAVLRKAAPAAPSVEPAEAFAPPAGPVDGFAADYPRVREQVRGWFMRRRRQGGRAALFGAGHVGLTYVTLMGIGGELECALDDNPHKQGMFLPGSRLPIRPSSALADGIDTVLLAVAPDREAAVLERLTPFRAAGGRIISIFTTSPHALRDEE